MEGGRQAQPLEQAIESHHVWKTAISRVSSTLDALDHDAVSGLAETAKNNAIGIVAMPLHLVELVISELASVCLDALIRGTAVIQLYCCLDSTRNLVTRLEREGRRTCVSYKKILEDYFDSLESMPLQESSTDQGIKVTIEVIIKERFEEGGGGKIDSGLEYGVDRIKSSASNRALCEIWVEEFKDHAAAELKE
ncbi:hypothetical protein SELMODRAFT_417026 [Selaginella moellendorffii]|uniref:Uncharacterized protein n=1 Tax=Selaginella moellendorffii TaxID=88036 RepID=D8S149_SELML|nr:hypothetical protein SELMODRAFT_417026 [Selaginella moellendorffii]